MAESEHSPSPKSRHSSGWSWEKLPISTWGKKGSELVVDPRIAKYVTEILNADPYTEGMARSSLIEDIYKISTELPWWAASALGGGLFYFLKYHMPTRMSESLRPAWEPMFSALSYGLLAICLAGAAVSLTRQLKRKCLFAKQTSIRTIRELSWLEFEHFTLEAFRRQGYDAKLTNAGADGGVDVVLEDADGIKLVQCKQWKTKQVGVKAIRELAGVVSAQNAQGGIFVCSGTYTDDAHVFARKADVELIGGKQLEALINPELRSYENASIEQQDTRGSCPRCGAGLVERTARRGSNAGNTFIGCLGFPKCRFTRNR